MQVKSPRNLPGCTYCGDPAIKIFKDDDIESYSAICRGCGKQTYRKGNADEAAKEWIDINQP